MDKQERKIDGYWVGGLILLQFKGRCFNLVLGLVCSSRTKNLFLMTMEQEDFFLKILFSLLLGMNCKFFEEVVIVYGSP